MKTLLITVLLAILLFLSSCASSTTPTPASPTGARVETPVPAPPSAAPFNEGAFWDSFPLPEDAELVPVVEGIDIGFATGMVEPDLFDFYANWLRERGWQQQAPTEARITRPHQRWRKGDAELLIELQPPDEQGRTVVWVQVSAGPER